MAWEPGQSWQFVHAISDFWESLCASIYDPARVVYGGVEVFRSVDGGASFEHLTRRLEVDGNELFRVYESLRETRLASDSDCSVTKSLFII